MSGGEEEGGRRMWRKVGEAGKRLREGRVGDEDGRMRGKWEEVGGKKMEGGGKKG